MQTGKFDFYAPFKMPSGRLIYGAAAMNRRIAEAGGMNAVAAELVSIGISLGMQAATAKHTRRGR